MQRNSEVLHTLRRTAPIDTDLEMSNILGLADKTPSTAIINMDKGLKGKKMAARSEGMRKPSRDRCSIEFKTSGKNRKN